MNTSVMQQTPEGRVFYIESTSSSDDGPTHAKLIATQSFLDRLLEMQSLCEKHNLTEVRSSRVPDEWVDSGVYNLPELVVTKTAFHFVELPRTYGEAEVWYETRDISVADFVKLAGEDQSKVAFLGGNPEELRTMLIDFGVLSEEDDPAPPAPARRRP